MAQIAWSILLWTVCVAADVTTTYNFTQSSPIITRGYWTFGLTSCIKTPYAWTAEEGDTAIFLFTGDAASVTLLNAPDGCLINVLVDGVLQQSPTTTWISNTLGTCGPNPSQSNATLLFSTTTLQDGDHNLTVVNTGRPPDTEFADWILRITDFSYSAPEVANTTTAPPSSTQSSTSTTATSTSTTAQTTAPAGQQTAASHASHSGATIGGAVGGALGALLILAIIVLCLRRRRRRSNSNLDLDEPSPVFPSSAPHLDPFVSSHTTYRHTLNHQPASFDPYAATTTGKDTTTEVETGSTRAPTAPSRMSSTVPPLPPGAGFTRQQIEILHGIVNRPDVSSQAIEAVVAGMAHDNRNLPQDELIARPMQERPPPRYESESGKD